MTELCDRPSAVFQESTINGDSPTGPSACTVDTPKTKVASQANSTVARDILFKTLKIADSINAGGKTGKIIFRKHLRQWADGLGFKCP